MDASASGRGRRFSSAGPSPSVCGKGVVVAIPKCGKCGAWDDKYHGLCRACARELLGPDEARHWDLQIVDVAGGDRLRHLGIPGHCSEAFKEAERQIAYYEAQGLQVEARIKRG